MQLTAPAWLALAALTALAVDRLAGEPPAWCHPVVGMGRWLGAFSTWLPAQPPRRAFWAGAALWAAGALAVTALAWLLERSLATLPWGSALAAGVLLKPLLAWRMLRDEVAAVEAALTRSLDEGRSQLARLVSRDVQALDATAVREAAIETLAENLNDSVIAPLCWFALGGLPGAALYRYANTADAMWGYRGRWEWAGKWAARVDDAMGWGPARLSAGLLCAAAGRWPDGATLRQAAAQTPSPNGGWPMGTMACLLGCRLAKPGVYTLHPAGHAPDSAALARAVLLAGRSVHLLALAAALTLSLGVTLT
jgi:adenosylcobinamide-phosphate synthase